MIVIDPVDDVVSDPHVTPDIHSVACTAEILISRPNADQCPGGPQTEYQNHGFHERSFDFTNPRGIPLPGRKCNAHLVVRPPRKFPLLRGRDILSLSRFRVYAG